MMKWNDQISPERARKILGVEFTDKLTASQCEARAYGAWLCNDKEQYAAYSALAKVKQATP